MNIYIDQDGNRSTSSLTKGSFDKIYSQAAFSKKKIKSGVWRSAVQRFEGECGKILSNKTLERKRRSRERIEKYRKAERKYTYLAANEKARVSVVKGEEMVLVRGQNGRFTGEKVTFDQPR